MILSNLYSIIQLTYTILTSTFLIDNELPYIWKSGDTVKEKSGIVFSIVKDNQPVSGCTISKEIYNSQEYMYYFSLARQTDISPELYEHCKLILLLDGNIDVYTSFCREKWKLQSDQCLITPSGMTMGIRSETGAVYAEMSIRREEYMNSAIRLGEVFTLADLVPYQEGKIVNMDIVHTETTKFAVMSFAAGTSLTEHAAPGDALIFALDGKGLIGYEGQTCPIQAGENFKFAKHGKHWIKADGPFKMALLLTLD